MFSFSVGLAFNRQESPLDSESSELHSPGFERRWSFQGCQFLDAARPVCLGHFGLVGPKWREVSGLGVMGDGRGDR